MEKEKKELTKETLLQALDTINEQADKFIYWYVYSLLYKSKYIELDGETIYLPYFGKDENVIFRLFDAFLKIKYPGYDILETSKELVIKLIKVATGEAERPGIILQGPVGTGKTFLILTWLEFRLKVINAYPVERRNDIQHSKIKAPSIIRYSPIELRTNFFQDGYAFIEKGAGNARKEHNRGEIMFIDDFGLGAIVNYFGAEVNILEELIYKRYEEFKRASNFEFYCTTNLRRKDVEDNFNPRFYSRVYEMASWEPFTGDDRRKGSGLIKQWPMLPELQLERPERW